MDIDISKLKFDEKGLIPAIVVDYATKKVLTLAYMNEQSLRITMDKSGMRRLRWLSNTIGRVRWISGSLSWIPTIF